MWLSCRHFLICSHDLAISLWPTKDSFGSGCCCTVFFLFLVNWLGFTADMGVSVFPLVCPGPYGY